MVTLLPECHSMGDPTVRHAVIFSIYIVPDVSDGSGEDMKTGTDVAGGQASLCRQARCTVQIVHLPLVPLVSSGHVYFVLHSSILDRVKVEEGVPIFGRGMCCRQLALLNGSMILALWGGTALKAVHHSSRGRFLVMARISSRSISKTFISLR